MEIKNLRYFLAVAREENMSKAAREIYMLKEKYPNLTASQRKNPSVFPTLQENLFLSLNKAGTMKSRHGPRTDLMNINLKVLLGFPIRFLFKKHSSYLPIPASQLHLYFPANLSTLPG
ncbi:MAG: LysR family transcriptional regulator [Butyrivibrio sp.]|uniref:LysR family transcriptional regulator n=1 Tax=Butyrivibrio sp. TaxID=28121 RepID=UPI001B1B4CD1|nr:LysR family transcriptional regulator [Butyrivibrio sp.]MBO6241576.1 LysR family transcriptional regulator [Butyrivibrio sp.]